LELGLVENNRRSAESEDDEESNHKDDDGIEEKERKRGLRSSFYKSQQVFSALDTNSDAIKLLSVVCAHSQATETARLHCCRQRASRGNRQNNERVGREAKTAKYVTGQVPEANGVCRVH
jgi:hypothetical protein